MIKGDLTIMFLMLLMALLTYALYKFCTMSIEELEEINEEVQRTYTEIDREMKYIHARLDDVESKIKELEK